MNIDLNWSNSSHQYRSKPKAKIGSQSLKFYLTFESYSYFEFFDNKILAVLSPTERTTPCRGGRASNSYSLRHSCIKLSIEIRL